MTGETIAGLFLAYVVLMVLCCLFFRIRKRDGGWSEQLSQAVNTTPAEEA